MSWDIRPILPCLLHLSAERVGLRERIFLFRMNRIRKNLIWDDIMIRILKNKAVHFAVYSLIFVERLTPSHILIGTLSLIDIISIIDIILFSLILPYRNSITFGREE